MPRLSFLYSDDRSRAQPPARRWLLLGVVMIGLVAMHFLSGHDSAGDHRVFPPTAAAGQHTSTGDLSVMADPGSGSTAAPADAPTGDGHAIIAGCILLLAAAAAAVLVLLRRPAVHRPPAMPAIRSGGLRGPPRSLSRLALCIERI